jgi:hypothetical protein
MKGDKTLLSLGAKENQLFRDPNIQMKCLQALLVFSV